MGKHLFLSLLGSAGIPRALRGVWDAEVAAGGTRTCPSQTPAARGSLKAPEPSTTAASAFHHAVTGTPSPCDTHTSTPNISHCTPRPPRHPQQPPSPALSSCPPAEGPLASSCAQAALAPRHPRRAPTAPHTSTHSPLVPAHQHRTLSHPSPSTPPPTTHPDSSAHPSSPRASAPLSPKLTWEGTRATPYPRVDFCTPSTCNISATSKWRSPRKMDFFWLCRFSGGFSIVNIWFLKPRHLFTLEHW